MAQEQQRRVHGRDQPPRVPALRHGREKLRWKETRRDTNFPHHGRGSYIESNRTHSSPPLRKYPFFFLLQLLKHFVIDCENKDNVRTILRMIPVPSEPLKLRLTPRRWWGLYRCVWLFIFVNIHWDFNNFYVFRRTNNDTLGRFNTRRRRDIFLYDDNFSSLIT